MNWMKYTALVTIITVALTGCGGGDKKESSEQKSKTQSQKSGQSKEQSSGGDAKKQAKGQQEKEQQMLTAHYLSEALEGKNNIKHATVVTRNKDAYVALEMNDKNDSVTEEEKNIIVQRIRETDPDIKNVYISTNAEFNTKMGSLTRDIERGTPAQKVNTFFDNLVRNVFPELKK